MAFLKSKTTASKISSHLIQQFGGQMSGGANPFGASKQALARIVSLESGDVSEFDREEINSSAEGLADEVRQDLSQFASENQVDTEYSQAQIDAGVGAVAAATSPVDYMKQGAEGGSIVSSIGGESGSLDGIATESYDESENRNTMILSFAYNLQAARQDEFGEAFFPTQTVGVEEAGVQVVADLISVQTEYLREIDGTYTYQYARQNVLRGLIDANVFKSEYTRNYPIVRRASTSKFVDAAKVAPYTVVNDHGETITTAPLAVGKSVDLLGISASDLAVSNGLYNQTDQLDQAIQLQNLYIELASGEVIKLNDLNRMPAATFVASPNNNDRAMNLNFDVRHFTANKDLKQVDGTAATIATQLNTLGYTLNYGFVFSGTTNTDTALTTTSATGIEVTKIVDATGTKIDLASAGVAALVAEFEGAKVIGYEVISRRVNSNKREQGQLLDATRERLNYAVPVLSPISIVRPTNESVDADAARIDSLVTSTYVRTSNSAVTALLEVESVLAGALADNDDNATYSSNVIGIGSYYVKTGYSKETFDVSKELNSLVSTDKGSDLQETMLLKIREKVADLYTHTGYGAAACAIHGASGGFKPKVVIGTDPYTASFLQLVGDTRTFGDNFDVEIVSSWDKRVANKIFITFGKAKSLGNDAANPFWFGNMYYRPQLVAVLNVSRPGTTTSRELTVHPQFTHVCHLPILAVIDVAGLKDAITKKTAIANKVTP